jgi:hypothetical protein
MDTARDGAAFLHVMYAFLVQHLFEIAAELRAVQRFGCEIAPQRLIRQVLANLFKTFLAVDQDLNNGPQGFFNFLVAQFVNVSLSCSLGSLGSHGILSVAV